MAKSSSNLNDIFVSRVKHEMDECDTWAVLMKSKSLAQVRHELDCLPNTSLLSLAAECLDHFMLANYAGFVEEQSVFGHYDEMEKEIVDEGLCFGCNAPYKFARSKLLLWLAKTILIEFSSRVEDGFTKNSLTCRLVLLWQNLLREPAVQLREILNSLDDVQVGSVSIGAATEALIERMYAHLMYNQVSKAEICLRNALAAIGLEIEVIGVLGKRTRFQENFIPQLIVKVVGDGKLDDDDVSEDESTLPPNVLLHDDSLLETVCTAATDSSSRCPKLPALSLACILAYGVLERKIQSTDDTVIEKCCSYIDEVITQRRNWALQVSALLQRSELERRRTRRVERACMQMESLSNLLNGIGIKEVGKDTLKRRLQLLPASGMKPFWYVDTVRAEILRSIGCTAESLLIFEKQEDWDNVIDCYQSLGQLEKAERLVRDLLAKNDNDSTYWCFLGDILHEPNAYERAIEVSNGRSFRAHRSLGMLMLQRKHYDLSYQHLKRSLELQPINALAWFNFGCCAWKLEKWDEAAKAYHECVRYEPAHFQAWNNLAAVYEKLNDAERAKVLLQEALKLNFEHIKLRENYMLLCIRTHDLSSAISAFHVLLDLDKQYKDDIVIEAVTQKLITLREENEVSAKCLTDMMCKLLGRITSQQTCSPIIWHCYAELKHPNAESCVNDYEIYVKLLERAFRACCNKKDWHKDGDSCIAVLNAAMKLSESKKVLSEMKNTGDTFINSEIRITLLPIIASIEKVYGVNAVKASSINLKDCYKLDSLLFIPQIWERNMECTVKILTFHIYSVHSIATKLSNGIMSSNEEAPTTSATASLTPSATVVSALPITVQAASHNSPAFVNLSVGELLQKQRRIALVTVPASRSVTSSSSVGAENRFPIKPLSRRSLTDTVMPLSSNCPLGITASSISVKKINSVLEDPNKLGEVVAETSQLSAVRKSNIIDAVKTETPADQPHLVTTSAEPMSILGSLQLDDLIRQIDPTSILDGPVKTMLTEFVDDFVDQVIERSCKLARHRGSDTLEPRDVEFVLRRYFNCPPLSKHGSETKSDSTENVQKNTEMAAHNQRMALIKKTLKKP
uniref:Transcription initiation factor TFIID subunit 12 n=1 Tax=Setaria digitata TaxID=48799 RepID=A0A915PPA7_9BILA